MYTFTIPLIRNGYFFIHQETIKEIEQNENRSFDDVLATINARKAGKINSLSLIKIKYNGTKQQHPTTNPTI
jgi:hypothetical protein